MKKVSIVCALLLLVLGADTALAHKPIFVEPESNRTRAQAVPIADPQVSWAVYAQLSKAGEVNYYTFTAAQDEPIAVSISVPQIAQLQDFGVSLALIGASLPTPNAALPFALERGEGVLLAPDGEHDPRKIFNEEFTQTSYWTRQTLRAVMPAAGTYTLAVYNSRSEVGKYVLAIGAREVFGVDDLLSFTRVRSTVRDWFAAPLDAPARAQNAAPQSNALVPALLALTLGVLLLGAIFWAWRARSNHG